ncbi:hypothetical protein [Bailinhaonella thermotolerans]|uniref:hypothetical protein n=1 Tax=Bailinhaonella thermotolerans TaxID=1070861 RepID=UPI00192A50D4|nr:hypothetical protein [Bailinhaonella thermotolerans]
MRVRINPELITAATGSNPRSFHQGKPSRRREVPAPRSVPRPRPLPKPGGAR